MPVRGALLMPARAGLLIADRAGLAMPVPVDLNIAAQVVMPMRGLGVQGIQALVDHPTVVQVVRLMMVQAGHVTPGPGALVILAQAVEPTVQINAGSIHTKTVSQRPLSAQSASWRVPVSR